MKIASCFRPELCVSNDIENLAAARLDTDCPGDARLVATNNLMLVAVPVTLEDGDTAGPVSLEALAVARKAAGKRASEIALVANSLYTLPDGFTMPRNLDVAPFPQWRQSVPAYKPGAEETMTIGLDVRLLALVVKAMSGSGDGRCFLTFPLTRPGCDMIQPIRVEVKGEGCRAIGVLAPVRTF